MCDIIGCENKGRTFPYKKTSQRITSLGRGARTTIHRVCEEHRDKLEKGKILPLFKHSSGERTRITIDRRRPLRKRSERKEKF